MLTIKHISCNDTDGIFDYVGLKQENDNEDYEEREITFEEAFDKIEEEISDNTDIILAYIGKEAIGYVKGKVENGANVPYYNSKGIFVGKKYRKQGYATILKREQIKLAQNYGCEELISSLDSKNKASYQLQKKLGAVMESEFGRTIASIFLRKSI